MQCGLALASGLKEVALLFLSSLFLPLGISFRLGFVVDSYERLRRLLFLFHISSARLLRFGRFPARGASQALGLGRLRPRKTTCAGSWRGRRPLSSGPSRNARRRSALSDVRRRELRCELFFFIVLSRLVLAFFCRVDGVLTGAS